MHLITYFFTVTWLHYLPTLPLRIAFLPCPWKLFLLELCYLSQGPLFLVAMLHLEALMECLRMLDIICCFLLAISQFNTCCALWRPVAVAESWSKFLRTWYVLGAARFVLTSGLWMVDQWMRSGHDWQMISMERAIVVKQSRGLKTNVILPHFSGEKHGDFCRWQMGAVWQLSPVGRLAMIWWHHTGIQQERVIISCWQTAATLPNKLAKEALLAAYGLFYFHLLPPPVVGHWQLQRSGRRLPHSFWFWTCDPFWASCMLSNITIGQSRILSPFAQCLLCSLLSAGQHP